VLAIQIWVLCVPKDAGIAGLLTSCSQARAVSAAIVAVAGVTCSAAAIKVAQVDALAVMLGDLLVMTFMWW
jgi:hypothetical protein